MIIFKKAIIIGVVIGIGIIVALQKWDLLFYGVIFLCPFMHLFMHAGHDRNNSHGNHKNQSDHDKDKNSNSSHRGCH